MRGYFGIGVEGISKAGNAGNLMRSAHAFGAGFFFTIAPSIDMDSLRQSDTSESWAHMPYYQYEKTEDMMLPKGCRLVGVELVPESVELPSFRHPSCAAYVLGPEMGSLSPQMLERCDFTVRIPMKFCVNVGVAGALVMYDRMMSTRRFPARPAAAGGPEAEPPPPPQKPRRIVRRQS